MADSSDEFDPESPEEGEVAGEAAGDRTDFLSLMGHAYRGELGRTTAWRTRIDRTTNWAVVLYYAAVVVLTFWPHNRQAKGELQSQADTEEWR